MSALRVNSGTGKASVHAAKMAISGVIAPKKNFSGTSK
jgi:hypothetical protein